MRKFLFCLMVGVPLSACSEYEPYNDEPATETEPVVEEKENNGNEGAEEDEFQIYLAIGQSNMQGNATPEEQDLTGVDARFMVMNATDCVCANKHGKKEEWRKAVPPLVRCYTGLSPCDYFGRTLVEKLPENIKVGIIPVAIAGSKIEIYDQTLFSSYIADQEDWMKNIASAYNNDPYGTLISLAKKGQETGVIKGILLHQGESNTGDEEWPEKVKKLYDRILNDLGLKAEDVPLLAGEVVSEDMKGVCAGMNKIIDKLPDVIPTAHVVKSTGCPAGDDNLHFSAEGYRMLGKRYAETMLEILNK